MDVGVYVLRNTEILILTLERCITVSHPHQKQRPLVEGLAIFKKQTLPYRKERPTFKSLSLLFKCRTSLGRAVPSLGLTYTCIIKVVYFVSLV